MRFGIVGLGRMGANLARSAIEHGHEIVGYDRDQQVTSGLAHEGIEPAASLRDLAGRLPAPRVVLLYLPHGSPTEQACDALRQLLDSGDVVVDGGNSHWEDSRRRHAILARAGIRFLDVGTSGGLRGARHGACFMAGGDRDAYALVEPVLRDLAVDERATLFVGEPGSGHFAKLIHNAIEFGMVQAIAEGVELLGRSEFTLDLPALFDNWSHGSVIRSWLIELMRDALEEHPDLGHLSTYVEDTGEVKWVLEWALDRDIPSPVISDSQQALMGYRDLDSPTAKAVALLRHGFGGHPLHRTAEPLARS
ncbi:MAG: 6-phosphogluconate dehydrogenase [Thermoleophilaceae bacterium]|nr:6-phosphogluconate dehydrogenase [Thermoleophilaceae bacterium]